MDTSAMDEAIIALFMKYIIPTVVGMVLLFWGLLKFLVLRWLKDMEHSLEARSTENIALNEKMVSLKQGLEQSKSQHKLDLREMGDELISDEIKPIWIEIQKSKDKHREEYREDFKQFKNEVIEVIKLASLTGK